MQKIVSISAVDISKILKAEYEKLKVLDPKKAKEVGAPPSPRTIQRILNRQKTQDAAEVR